MGNDENSKPYSGVSCPLEKARRPTPLGGFSGTDPVSMPAAPLAILLPEVPQPAPVVLPEASAVEPMTPTPQPSSRVSLRDGDITAVPAISQSSDPDSGPSSLRPFHARLVRDGGLAMPILVSYSRFLG